MTSQDSANIASPSVPLPRESGSRSEILDATHLFSVEVQAVRATSWTPRPDGLEHRQLILTFKLIELFKGNLNVRPATLISVEVPQRRESAFSTSDYYGLWSHQEPTLGLQYLVSATGETTLPETLLQEPYCKHIFDGSFALDAKAALRVEALFRRSLTESAEDPAGPARQILKLAFAERAVLHDLFVRYLWVRLQPAWRSDWTRVWPDISSLISAGDANLSFTRALIGEVDNAYIALDRPKDLSIKWASFLLSLLAKVDSSHLHEYLVEARLPNLILPEGLRPLPLLTVLPRPEERDAVRKVLKTIGTERAREILKWLKE